MPFVSSAVFIQAIGALSVPYVSLMLLSVQENPKAMLRHEHAASMRLQLEETLGTLMGTSLRHYTSMQLYRD